MDTASTSESVTLMLPNADLSFLRTLSKKMGWTFRRHRKTGIEKGLDDIKKGKVYHAKNSEDLIVLDILQEKGQLPAEYRPHRLHGNYEGCWECHITSDWLLIWQQDDKQLRLILVDTGSHSDLF